MALTEARRGGPATAWLHGGLGAAWFRVGPVLAVSVSGGSDREELIDYSPGG